MFPDVLRDIILDYAAEWKLIEWVDPGKLSSKGLARNPRAVDYLLENIHDIRWAHCSANPSMFYIMRDLAPELIVWAWMVKTTNQDAVDYMIANIDKLQEDESDHLLSRNPLAVPWLREHPEYISWSQLSANPAAVDILRDNPDKISMMHLTHNSDPWAIALIEQNLDEVWIYGACSHDSGLELIKKYGDPTLPYIGRNGIAWSELCKRENPEIVAYVLEHPKRIDWNSFSRNPSAFDYLERHRDKIDYAGLSENPRIFEAAHPEGVRELL